MNLFWTGWNLVLAAAVINTVAGLLLKRSRIDVPDDSLMSLILSPWLIMAMICYTVNVVLFAKSLDKLPVSAAYPVLAGVGFGLIAIFSKLFFDERLASNQWIGLVVIFIGVILISRP